MGDLPKGQMVKGRGFICAQMSRSYLVTNQQINAIVTELSLLGERSVLSDPTSKVHVHSTGKIQPSFSGVVDESKSLIFPP